MLCVENPDEPELDMGKSSFQVAKIRRAFEHAYQLLSVAITNTENPHSYLGYVIRGDDPLLTRRLDMKQKVKK